MSEPETIESMASKGGKAAAAKMTADERRDRARKAAEGRWAKDAPRATHMGEIELAGTRIPCAVLEDGRRVLSQIGFMQAIGRTGQAKTATASSDGGNFNTPAFLAADNLKPFLDKHLRGTSTDPIVYRSVSGNIGYGYEANLLPVVCNIYLDARRAKVVKNPHQKKVVLACEVLVGALARLGIDALVDEATGFQYSRERDALQRLLEQYVSKELARWERTFDPEFYRHMYRLKGWRADPNSTKRTHAAARLTVNLTYNRIHPDLLKELKSVREEKGKPSQKLFQWLTTCPAGGHPRLKQHLEGVVALMSVAQTWGQFQEWVDMRYPELNKTLRIPFPDYGDETEAQKQDC